MRNFYENYSLVDAGRPDSDRGLYELFNNRYSNAKKHFDLAITASPRNLFFYERRACVNIMLKLFEEAIADIDTYLMLFKPNYYVSSKYGVYNLKIISLISLNKLAMALELTEELLSLFPGSVKTHYFTGIIYSKSNDFASALSSFKLANPATSYGSNKLPIHTHRHVLKLIDFLSNQDFLKTGKVDDKLFSITYPASFFGEVMHEGRQAIEYLDRISGKRYHTPAANFIDYTNTKTCERCQMSPCHCSDPDLD